MIAFCQSVFIKDYDDYDDEFKMADDRHLEDRHVAISEI